MSEAERTGKASESGRVCAKDWFAAKSVDCYSASGPLRQEKPRIEGATGVAVVSAPARGEATFRDVALTEGSCDQQLCDNDTSIYTMI